MTLKPHLFKHKQVCSGMDLAVIAQSQHRLPDFDVDASYEEQVKSLYSAIIIIISRAGFSWQEEQSGDIRSVSYETKNSYIS